MSESLDNSTATFWVPVCLAVSEDKSLISSHYYFRILSTISLKVLYKFLFHFCKLAKHWVNKLLQPQLLIIRVLSLPVNKITRNIQKFNLSLESASLGSLLSDARKQGNSMDRVLCYQDRLYSPILLRKSGPSICSLRGRFCSVWQINLFLDQNGNTKSSLL